MFRVTRYPMISKTESGRVGYQKKYRVAGRVRVPAGHWCHLGSCCWGSDHMRLDLLHLLCRRYPAEGGPCGYVKVSFNCAQAHASHLLSPIGLELLGEVNTDNMEVVNIKWLYIYRKFFSVSCQRQGNRWTEDCGWVPCNRCWDLHKSKCRCTQLNRREIYAIARPWKLRYCGQTRKLGLRDGLLWHRWCGVPSWFWPTGELKYICYQRGIAWMQERRPQEELGSPQLLQPLRSDELSIWLPRVLLEIWRGSSCWKSPEHTLKDLALPPGKELISRSRRKVWSSASEHWRTAAKQEDWLNLKFWTTNCESPQILAPFKEDHASNVLFYPLANLDFKAVLWKCLGGAKNV